MLLERLLYYKLIQYHVLHNIFSLSKAKGINK